MRGDEHTLFFFIRTLFRQQDTFLYEDIRSSLTFRPHRECGVRIVTEALWCTNISEKLIEGVAHCRTLR